MEFSKEQLQEIKDLLIIKKLNNIESYAKNNMKLASKKYEEMSFLGYSYLEATIESILLFVEEIKGNIQEKI